MIRRQPDKKELQIKMGKLLLLTWKYFDGSIHSVNKENNLTFIDKLKQTEYE